MNRNSHIRSLALAIAFAALAAGGIGCAGQSTDQGDVSNDPSRKAHLVGLQGTSEDGPVRNVEHSLDTSHTPVHPATGTNLGPRPEPWMDGDDSSGPRPEPWSSDTDEDSKGTNNPPSGGSGTSSGSSSSSGGSGSGGSSGGNPANSK